MPKRFRKLRSVRSVEWIERHSRAVAQEVQSRLTLANYRSLAAYRGLSSPTTEQLRLLLRQRIRARQAIRGYPSAMGHMHIFLAYYVSNWEAVLPQTLMPFGEVSEFEWRSHGFDDTSPDWLWRRDAMNREMLDAFRLAHKRRPVDAVIGYLSGDNTSASTLRAMADAGAVILNFCWDDKIHMPGRMRGGRLTGTAAIAGAVDLNMTNAPESVVKYMVHGGLAGFFPPAAFPETHRPYNVPFEFDVTFVGARYGWRPWLISELQRHGIKVECFGRGWPNGSLSETEMVKLYSRSRINLGLGGVGQSFRQTCIKGRDFEVPMSGGLYLTTHNPELSLIFDVGHEIVTYRTPTDCAATIRELLANPSRAADIRHRGLARSLKDHTYLRRWKDVFEFSGLLKPDVADNAVEHRN
jgi:spore maturation protein CgeB